MLDLTVDLPDWITENLPVKPLKGKFIDLLPK